MNQEKDYQTEYFEEKFKSVDNQFYDFNRRFSTLEKNINDLFGAKLEQIHQQTKRTNGHVSDHENRIKEVEKKQYSCPIDRIKKEQEIMKEETDAVRFFSRNPSMLKSAIMGSSFLSIIAISITILRMLNLI